MEIIYRSGKKSDSSSLAELINIASDGTLEYLFRDLIPDLTPVQIIANNLAADNYPHSYKSAIVAEFDRKIVGMSLSYPVDFHKITPEMTNFFPVERLEHFQDFYNNKIENSWFIDALCVARNYRKKGIGSKLIFLTKKKARENGYNILSLIVFADNINALKMYEKYGFKIVKRIDLKPDRLIPHQDGCFLMKFEIK